MVRDGRKGADIVENGIIVPRQIIQQSASMGYLITQSTVYL